MGIIIIRHMQKILITDNKCWHNYNRIIQLKHISPYEVKKKENKSISTQNTQWKIILFFDSLPLYTCMSFLSIFRYHRIFYRFKREHPKRT